jgi:hypothetical protein
VVASEAVTTLLRRVRDPQGSQHTPTVVLRLLTDVQRILNALYADVVESQLFTAPPRVMHYPLGATVPKAIRLLSVQTDASRDLAPLKDWRELALLSRSWFRTLGDRPLVWAPVGRDAFVVWPGVDRELSLTAVYVRQTDELDLTTIIELSPTYWPLLLDLVEGCLLMRGRMFGPSMDAVTERLKAGFQPRERTISAR